MFGQIGIWQILIVALVVLVLFGRGRISFPQRVAKNKNMIYVDAHARLVWPATGSLAAGKKPGYKYNLHCM